MGIYRLETQVRLNDKLRASFNELTKQIFCFDFVDWYNRGLWSDGYQPYCLVDGGCVVANVSLNHLRFLVDGVERKFIQLGTVMTKPEYRGQGLSRQLMEHILAEFPVGDTAKGEGKVDGIYLFGNDSVKEFYPKFGFEVSSQMQPFLPTAEFAARAVNNKPDNTLKQLNLWESQTVCDCVHDVVKRRVPNEKLSLLDNPGLYMFWLTSEYGGTTYYNKLQDAYVVLEEDDAYVKLVDIEADHEVDLSLIISAIAAKCFSGSPLANDREFILGFTPLKEDGFEKRVSVVEDCTYFIMGEQLKALEAKGWMYPELSHA